MEQSSLASNPNTDRVRKILQSLNAVDRREVGTDLGMGPPVRPPVPARGMTPSPEPPSKSFGDSRFPGGAKAPPLPYWATALFIFLGVGLMWVPSLWLVESVRSLHGQRELTPAWLSGPTGRGPVLAARRPTVIRPAVDGTCPVTFRLLAPAAREVLLGGSFNGFNGSHDPLARGEDGIWETTLSLRPGRHTYKFKVDGEWLLDPTNPKKTPKPRESSLIDVVL